MTDDCISVGLVVAIIGYMATFTGMLTLCLGESRCHVQLHPTKAHYDLASGCWAKRAHHWHLIRR